MEGKNTFDVPRSEENSQLQPKDTRKVTDNSNIRVKLSNSCSGIVWTFWWDKENEGKNDRQS